MGVFFNRSTSPPLKATPQKSGLPHLGRAFTDVQELKQASCLIYRGCVGREMAWFQQKSLQHKVT